MQTTVGDNIRRIREEKGLTQEQLGDHLHVAKQTVSSYESGRRRPKAGTLLRFAQALDVPIEDLLAGVSDADDPDGTLCVLQGLSGLNQEARQAARQGDAHRLRDLLQTITQISDDMGAQRILAVFQTLNPANREKLIAYGEGLAAAQPDTPEPD